MMIDESDWVTVFSASGQSALVTVPLSVPADLALVRVTLSTPRPEWRRAGWVKQYAVIDNTRYLLVDNAIELDGELTVLYPATSSEIIFSPVQWLDNWSISIKIRQSS